MWLLSLAGLLGAVFLELNSMSKDESINRVDLRWLFPNLPQGKPVTSKLPLLLQQLNWDITKLGKVNNQYLARLVKECELFLPELFQSQWEKHWQYSVALELIEGGGWATTEIDFAINDQKEVRLLDWSGIDNNPYSMAQAYLLAKRLDLRVEDICLVCLVNNKLGSNLSINFIRQYMSPNDFVICKQDLPDRLAQYLNDDDNPVVEEDKEAKLAEARKEIDSIPEVQI